MTWIGLSAGLAIPPADARTLRTDFPVTDGPVEFMEVSGNTLYIGGGFQHVGPYTGSGVPIDIATGAALGSLRIDGPVHAIASDHAGGWFIGGSFSRVGTHPRSNLAHVRADLTVSPWDPGASARVRALAVRGGVVYVGGTFHALGGAPRMRLGAVDATTGLVTTWRPNPNDSINAISVLGDIVYVGGAFTTMGGQGRHYIAALDAETGVPTTWDPDANDAVRCVTASLGVVYAGGEFRTIGGQDRDWIAALDAATGVATEWNPHATHAVDVLAFEQGIVYAGGAFDSIGGAARTRLAALDAVSGAATAWDPQANGAVLALLVHGTAIYAAGDFTRIGGQERLRIAALHPATGAATAWNPRTSGLVRALAVGEGMVFAGGDFSMVGTHRRNRLAAIDIGSGVVKPWDPNSNGSVQALTATGDAVYAGGGFTEIGGASRPGLAAVDTSIGSATTFSPSGFRGGASTMTQGDGLVFIGGWFHWKSSSHSVFCTAAFRHGTSEPDVAWASNLGGGASIYALTVSDSTLYYSGEDRHMGARNIMTGAYTSWNPEPILHEDDGLSGYVSRIAAERGGPVYVAGRFISIGGAARNCLAALDPGNGLATDWSPGLWVDPFASPYEPIKAILPLDGTVYVGGLFEGIGGQARLNLAAIDASTGLASGWDPAPNGLVSALETSGKTLFVGGYYTTIADAPWPYLSAFTEDVAEPPPSPVASLAHGSMPNPFAHRAEIRFTLPGPSKVSLEVFDVAGRCVTRLIDDEPRDAGPHSARFEPRGLAAGVYLYRLTAGSQVVTRKMLFLR